MHGSINKNPHPQHPRNNPKAHEVLRRIILRKQIRAIYLRQITQCVDQRQRHSAHLCIHAPKCRGRKAQRNGVGCPQSCGHEDEQDVSREEVVDCADCDGHCHGEGEPGGDDNTPGIGEFIGEETCYSGADEGYGIDGDLDGDLADYKYSHGDIAYGHVLRLDRVAVAQASDERWIEVGQSGGTYDDLEETLSTHREGKCRMLTI